MRDPMVLVDMTSGDSPHPYLVFDGTSGAIIIADDFETTNDSTAREFIIGPDDAVKLAFELLGYSRKNKIGNIFSDNDDER